MKSATSSPSFRLFAVLLAMAATSVPALAQAQDLIEIGDEPAPAASTSTPADSDPVPGGCAKSDLTCRARLERVLTGIRLATPEIVGGFRWNESGPSGAVEFKLEGIGWDLPLGDLEALVFEMIEVPQAGGFRVRFTTASAEAEYFCRAKDDLGNSVTRGPFAGISQDCEPMERWGMGGTLIEYQKDTDPQRWAARWLQIHAVLNFLKNGYSHELLHRRLTAFAGLSVDSWGTPKDSTSGIESGTALRGAFGITGMLRTENNRLELRGLAAVRPNFIEWQDWAVETRIEALYRFLFGSRVVAEAGIRADYSHWSMPERSIGSFASSTDPDTVFAGALFGIRWR